jgi:hypothetical protein
MKPIFIRIPLFLLLVRVASTARILIKSELLVFTVPWDTPTFIDAGFLEIPGKRLDYTAYVTFSHVNARLNRRHWQPLDLCQGHRASISANCLRLAFLKR